MQIFTYILIGIVILLIILGLAIVNFSHQDVIQVMDIYEYNSSSSLNALELINKIAQSNNIIMNVSLTNEKYKESYNHASKTIILSQKNAYSSTITALTVTAHELGHFMQFTRDEKKYKKFVKKYRLSNFVSKLFLPFILAGVVLFFIEGYMLYSLISFGISVLCFLISLSFKMSNLKIEKEASSIAINILENVAEFNEDELKASKQILNSAKNTYLADVLKSLLKWTVLTRR